MVEIFGTGAKFDSLKEAVDNAKEGDSIIVYPGKYICSDEIFLSVSNVSIIGIGKPQILCDNMKANVMWIQSDHVLIKGIKASHVKPDFWANCVGNVFALDNAHDIVIENCEINGCGRIGVYTSGSQNVLLRKNWIHNNSLCAVQLNDVNLFKETKEYIGIIKFTGNRIQNNGEGKQDLMN